jgi:dextranase
MEEQLIVTCNRVNSMQISSYRYLFQLALLLCLFGSLLLAVRAAHAGTLNGPLIRVVNYDRAAYAPGTEVSVFVTLQNTTATAFTGSIDLAMSSRGQQIGSAQSESVTALEPGASATLTFRVRPPAINYRGYLLSIRAFDAQHKLMDEAGGAIDVSSDWLKFPRYGYVTTFTAGTNALALIQALNTYHINGLQFYDVNYEHHRPYSPNQSWPNLSNTVIDRQVVLDLIHSAHQYGMKAMDYNLWNGAYPDYLTDGSGAQLAWGQFASLCAPHCGVKDQTGYFGFPSSWAARSLLEMNPGNPGWQNYLFNNPQGEVQLFEHLPYDGWHIDTLGDSAIEYDFHGKPFWLGDSLASFVNHAKAAIGNRPVLINSVDRWNQPSVASHANVDFLYTELWGDTANYADLNAATRQARTYSAKPIVFPAYMNTVYAQKHKNCATCFFDEASVRLVDDAMLAAGGIHFEMGDMDKMLSYIYWPGPMLHMTPSLQEADLDIANFAVAYEDLLRYGVTDAPNTAVISGAPSSTNGSSGSVWILPKQKTGFQMMNLINLVGNTSTAWRDEDASYRTPPEFRKLKVRFYYAGTIVPGTSRLMMASPDYDHGQSVELPYEAGSDSAGQYVDFTLPRLFYWDLIYLETTGHSGPDYDVNPFAGLKAVVYNNASMGGVGVLDSSDSDGGEILGNACCGRWVEYDNLDFGGGAGTVALRSATALGGVIELRLDRPSGPVIARATIPDTGGWQSWKTLSFPLSGARGKHNLYLVFPGSAVNVNSLRFALANPHQGPPSRSAASLPVVP